MHAWGFLLDVGITAGSTVQETSCFLNLMTTSLFLIVVKTANKQASCLHELFSPSFESWPIGYYSQVLRLKKGWFEHSKQYNFALWGVFITSKRRSKGNYITSRPVRNYSDSSQFWYVPCWTVSAVSKGDRPRHFGVWTPTCKKITTQQW